MGPNQTHEGTYTLPFRRRQRRTSPAASHLSRSRVDYKAILTPEEFTAYTQLRELRKELAQLDAVPVYALFTNEQLALMVQRRCRSKGDLEQIEGIGESKIDKYGERMLLLLQTLGDRRDASSGEPV
jgi:superfamily II DNA helicase RecQ